MAVLAVRRRGTAVPSARRAERDRLSRNSVERSSNQFSKATSQANWGHLVSRVRLALAAAALIALVGIAATRGSHRAAPVYAEPEPTKPVSKDTYGARVIHFTIANGGRILPEVAVIPAGSAPHPRPLLVLLHELIGDPSSTLTQAVFATLSQLGPEAPDIVSPYSPADSYWHDRAGLPPNYETGGDWGSYVISQVIPRAIALLHADPRRIAIAGNSMGGFGALDIARLHPGVFCAVAAHSPALFASYSSSAPTNATLTNDTISEPGNFDNAADFARHNLLRIAALSTDLYGHTPVWIDAGSRDPHVAADRKLADLLREHGTRVQFHIWPGGHENAYWNSHQGDYFRFYAAALASCTH
jgi:S-formylglutathione hydrolase FrmB